jgi:hypothetical protein
MQSEVSGKLENAEVSIRESAEPLLKVTAERDSHLLKQEFQMVVTDEGTQIDRSDTQPENALALRAKTLQSGSKMITIKDRQSAKQWSPSSLMNGGMQIEASHGQ